MKDPQELAQFWERHRTVTAKHLARVEPVYACRDTSDSAGTAAGKDYRIGVAMIAADGLAFLRNLRPIPIWAWVLFPVGLLAIAASLLFIGFYTDDEDVPKYGGFALGAILISGLSWLHGWAFKVSDPRKITRSVQNPSSVFVPFSRVEAVSEYRPPGWASLTQLAIRFQNNRGEVELLFLGDMPGGRVGFRIDRLRDAITSELARRDRNQ